MELFSIPSVAGIIEKEVNDKKYILLQERWKEGKELENGLIEVPGGKVREYENIFDCLRREVYEETGLTVEFIQGECNAKIVQGHGYKVLQYTPFSCAQNIQGTYPIMVEIFICRVSGEPLKETNESRNIGWKSIDELRELVKNRPERVFPMHLVVLEKYLD